MTPCIKNIDSISSRIISLTLKSKNIIAVIGAYAPTAFAPKEGKDDFYARSEEKYKKLRNTHATFIMGDMNARVGTRREGGHTLL